MLTINLLYKDKKSVEYKVSDLDETLLRDLEFEHILKAMCQNDYLLRKSLLKVLLSSDATTNDIDYRQDIHRDFIEHPELIEDMYRSVTEILETKRKNWWSVNSQYYSSKKTGAIYLVKLFMDGLVHLKKLLNEYPLMTSEGLNTLKSMLNAEFNEEFINKANQYLKELRFDNGILIKATNGYNHVGINYQIVQPLNKRFQKVKWHFSPGFSLHPKDESGFKDLNNRKEKSMSQIIDTLVESAIILTSLFEQLKVELAYYKGVNQLYNKYKTENVEVTFPMDSTLDNAIMYQNLKDASLSLLQEHVVGNSLNNEYSYITLVTGANQGGKTTFLRSYGQALIMQKAGMFVVAESFSHPLIHKVYTHFSKKEDETLKQGKLEEELSRLSTIISSISKGDIILLNESFSTTNEVEGSQIAYNVLEACIDNQIQVVAVTHFYYLCNLLLEKYPSTISLLAKPREDKTRTFKLHIEKPKSTGYSLDIYNEVFNDK